MKRLSPKEETFCQAYLETGKGAEAYRRAYGAVGAKNSTISCAVNQMLNDKKIMARIEEIRTPILERMLLTYEGHLRELAELRDMAIAKGHFAAAIRAEECRGRAAGFYKERVEVSGPGGVPLPAVITINFVHVTRHAD